MTNPFQFRGRSINKGCCLSFLGLTAALLCAAGVSAGMDKTDLSVTLLILSGITGAFSAVYGVLWAVWGRKESRAEAALQTLSALDRAGREQETSAGAVREFTLPRDRLIGAARGRFYAILRGLLAAALGVAVLLGIILAACGALKSPAQVLYIALFSLLIEIPGLVIQWRLFDQYARSVPERIRMFPGRLEVDDRFFSAGQIREIRLSPDRVWNPDSPAVFRKMRVETDAETVTWSLDFRSGKEGKDQPFWPDYGALTEALEVWGTENGVTVQKMFME